MTTLKLYPHQRNHFFDYQLNKLKFSSFFATICCVLLSYFLQVNTANAQGYTCNSCSANDVGVESVELVSTTPNPLYDPAHPDVADKYLPLPTTCTGGQTLSGYIKITIDQNATTRYGLDIEGDLYVDGVQSGTFANCDNSDFVKGVKDKFYVDNSALTWTCGTELQLKNVFVGWGNSAGARACDDLCGIGPHCNKDIKNIVFTVITPLSADFTYSGVCTAGNAAQTITFDASATTGGTSPYVSYEWDFDNDGQYDDGTGVNPSFTFASSGTKSVGLKVTDDNPAAVSTITKSVTVGSCCVPSSLKPTVTETPPTCADANGSVTVTSPVGADYEYSDDGGTSYQSTTIFTVAAGASYSITVRQISTQCVSTATTGTMGAQPQPPSVALTSQTNVLCFGASTGAINITASGGTAPYTYDWDDLAGTNDPEDRSGLAAGTYKVTVKGANGCSAAPLSVTITQPASAVAVVKTSQTNVLCFGASTGAINITASGGTAPYTYDWDDLAGTNDPEDRSGLAAGTYKVIVNDANGCTTDELSVTITQPASAVAVVKTSQTNVLCFGASTGAINITASGGTAPYTYDWDDLAGTNDPEDRSGLAAGTYKVIVKDANGCTTDELSVTITQPASTVAVVKTSQTNVLCFGASTGAINITASGGTAPYTYDWDDLAGTNDPEDRSGLAAGTYKVIVKDANGCTTDELSVTITQPASAVAVVKTSQTNVLCFGASTGAINITASGGTSPYTYDWDDLAGTNDPEDRSGLAADTYKVIVKDANGCTTDELSVTITQPASAVAVVKTSQTNVLCFGASTGAINITASGGTSPYTYDWDDLAGTNDPEDRSGLAAGTYKVIVKDANGCTTDELSVTITQPASAVAVVKTSQTNVLCFGASTGAINITASGGTAPYTYDWDDLAGTNDPEDRSGLAAGTYKVIVKDANGCTTDELSVTITQPASAVAVVKTSQTNVLCFGASTGAINITASGGTAPYTYDWDDLAGTNDPEDRSGLAAGTYKVIVNDANGCTTDELSVTITQPASAVAVVKTSQTNVLCFGASTGAINITASGGTAPYTYDWDDLAGTNDPEDRSGLAAGTYKVIVKDANGCTTDELSVTISQPASTVAVVKTSQTNVLCFGASTGAINITASGGTSPYTYDWTDIAGTSNPEDRSGLAAGTYTVTVKDANGCTTAPLSVTITQPASAVTVVKTSQTNVLCNGASTGAINITASGGTSPYTYDWTDIAGTSNPEDRSGLAAGTYTVTVKDANGCSTAPLSVTIAQPTAITINSISSNTPLCSGSTLNLGASASGGTGTLSYHWTGPNSFSSDLQNPSITNVTTAATGTYTVVVKDANNCTKNSTTQVTVKPLPTVSFTVAQACVSGVPKFTLTATTNGTSIVWSKSAGADGSFTSTTTSPTTYTPGPLDKANGVTITLTASLNGCCKSTSKTILTASCSPYFSYTQGYYHNNGTGCTPSNGSKTGLQMIQLALDNMDGILGNSTGQLYLGKSGASFTVTYSQASKLQAILPGGSTSGKLLANYNLNSTASYPPLSSGKISNILLSQTITLALNIKIPNNGLGAFILKDGYLTTMTKSGTSCTGPVATCSNGGTISSLKITTNATLMNLLRNQRVDSLLKLASKALGGTLPSGVSYSNISDAVNVINVSFDGGRYSLGYYPTQKSCGSGGLARSVGNETIDLTTNDLSVIDQGLVSTDMLKVTAYPNPFTDKVKFSIESTVSGKASLDVFNGLGQKLHTIYQGYLFAGSKQTIDYNVPSTFKGSLFYILKIGDRQVNGKLIQIK